MIDLIKWCFRDETSGFCTVIIIGMIFSGVVQIIKAFKGKK